MIDAPRRVSSLRAFASAFCTLCALGAAACDDPRPASDAAARRSVVLVSIDSIRADHCSLHGYRAEFAPTLATTPFLERIGARGVVFETAVSPSSWTLPAHVSLLTGLGCTEHGVRGRSWRMPADVEPLAESFARAGHATAGFFSGPLLHPAWGFGRGFDTYTGVVSYDVPIEALAEREIALGPVYEKSHGDALCSERVVDAALTWLDERDSTTGPFFLFLHLWDPHYDYAPPAELAHAFDPDYAGAVDGSGFMDVQANIASRDLAHWRALYDAEIRYTDDQLARFWAELEKRGLTADTLLVVTGDHGEEFFDHGKRGHNRTLFDEVVRVPLIVSAPGLVPSGLRVKAQVGIVDIAPTLLDLCGLAPQGELTGVSLRPTWELERRSGRPLVLDLHAPAFNAVLRAWRDDRVKVVWDSRRNVGTRFDLVSDPLEQSGETLQSLARPDLARVRRDFERARAAARAPLAMSTPAELRSELERLGYSIGDDE